MKINSFLGVKPFCNTNKIISNNISNISFASHKKEHKDVFVLSKPKELDEAIQRINSDNDINPTIKARLAKLCASSKYYSPMD